MEQKWINIVLGDTKRYPLRNRVLSSILLGTLLIGILIEGVNLKVALNEKTHFLAIASILSSACLYTLNRIKRRASTAVAWMWLIAMVLLILGEWSMAVEVKRVGILVAAAVMIFVPATLKGWNAIAGVLLMVLTLFAILYYDFQIASIRTSGNASLESLILLDRYISGICMGIGGAFIMFFIVWSYEMQALKVRVLNRELDALHKDALLDNASLTELNQMKDSLLSIIAHDLKNPIGGISTLSQTLANDGEIFTDLEKKELLDLMKESSQLAYELLNDLLVWAKSESGIFELKPVNIEVHSCIENEVQLHRVLLDEKSIEFENECCTKHLVFADNEMTQIIYRNLISNAIKYTPRGGVISATSEQRRDSVVTIISDNGVGMSPEKLNSLFSGKPVPSHPGTKQETGSGLGLRFVDDFVKRNGGKIRAESVEEKGTTIYLTLPSPASR